MCGMSFSLTASPFTPCHEDIELVRNRGPDLVQILSYQMGAHVFTFVASVLHIRGQAVTKQPVHDDHHIFLWNGELYSGIEVLKYKRGATFAL